MDLLNNPYPTPRRPLLASRGMVATSQPLASAAGLEMLQAGGSAVDAALAMAMALTVVEPTSNGIGGDAFALVWDGGKLHGLNGSGAAPMAIPIPTEPLKPHGWPVVTVPGAPRAWADLHAKFGRLPFEFVCVPAIRYAREGFPVSPVVAHFWVLAARRYAESHDSSFEPWMKTFTRDGVAPVAGSWWTFPDHARTLEAIAASKSAAFYEGELAKAICAYSEATGGFFTPDDFARHTSEWVDPISTRFRGHEVHEIPPNGQGIATLIAMNILEDAPRDLHREIEAVKLAMSAAYTHVADPRSSEVPTAELLSPEYALKLRAEMRESAIDPMPLIPRRGGTVYLCAADGEGQMVSYIQSNFYGFGSGLVVPGTGIALHNRGYGFSVDPEHPNVIAPGKRPFHTIIPGFLTRDGAPIGPFGVMGGHMQPQGHLQVVLRTLEEALHPQSALDAPRWRWDGGLRIAVEPGIDPEPLRARGHQVTVEEWGSGFGRGQIIWRLPEGGYIGGSDGRADGCVMGY